MCTSLGEISGVHRSLELYLGLDVVVSIMCVASDGDEHAAIGMKVRTIYGGEVDPHVATM